MKTVVITGGTSGIGQVLVEYFAKNNWEVIFTGRNAESAGRILDSLSDCKLRFFETDFASFEHVVKTADEIVAQYPVIDVLINNAGVWEMQFKETTDGIETNFAVNHLSPMLFTLKLLPRINPESGRILNTSSGAHRRNILDLADPEWRQKAYDGIATYSQSKLCNILFTNRLARDLSNSRILVNTVHPGLVKTNLFNKMGERNWSNVPNAWDGARSAIFAATDNAVVNRSNLYIYQERLDPNITELAKDRQVADSVWELSMGYIQKYLAG
ncbi:MAG: SDR family NAD(P)-dependent oxidoreductase [Saprospiraceae bacterium]|nr:SDR family NAD(P)-dependent oxidoreductase [Saprospiraceae bacterium]